METAGTTGKKSLDFLLVLLNKGEMQIPKILKTVDGSPSLELINSKNINETMHSQNGAFTETIYIYYEALKAMASAQLPIRVVSVGLGIGYNEILTLAEALRRSCFDSDFFVQSYESEPWLRQAFHSWGLKQDFSSEQEPLFQAYNQILQLVSDHLNLDAAEVRNQISAQLKKGHIELGASLTKQSHPHVKFHGILYDAFSSKMTPELWSEDFLVHFLSEFAHPQCVLTTYAATGALKRALKKNGFEVIKRSGFCGKRESTFAVRGFNYTIT